MIKDFSVSEDHIGLMYINKKDGKLSKNLISQNIAPRIGKVNNFLKALIDIGFIKIYNFNNFNKKLNNAYILTSQSTQEKKLQHRNLLSKRNKNTINLTHTLTHIFYARSK